jgi:hypothetical protein
MTLSCSGRGTRGTGTPILLWTENAARRGRRTLRCGGRRGFHLISRLAPTASPIIARASAEARLPRQSREAISRGKQRVSPLMTLSCFGRELNVRQLAGRRGRRPLRCGGRMGVHPISRLAPTVSPQGEAKNAQAIRESPNGRRKEALGVLFITRKLRHTIHTGRRRRRKTEFSYQNLHFPRCF